MTQQPPTQQQQNGVPLFSEKIGALPAAINTINFRAVGLHETNARLAQQQQYWLEHDGAEVTASAPGAKAAEKARRYIQHLVDRGGDSAPKCPMFLELHMVQLRLKALDQQNQNQQQQMIGDQRDSLTSEEQAQLASLVPLTYVEALTYLPSLGRFQQQDVEEVLSALRS